MPYTLDQLHENARVLQDDIAHLESRRDACADDTPEAESLDRILNVKWRLYSEQRDLIDIEEDRACLVAAQARWQHHFDNDTQDLY